MLDISGFLTSNEFFGQLAAIISALLSALFNQLLAGLFVGF